MIELLVFSKNRAAQLDLFLTSLLASTLRTPFKTTILYSATNDEFNKGYEKVIYDWTYYDGIRFIKETNFRQDSLDWIDSATSNCVGLCTDDSIIYRNFDLSDERLKTLFDSSGSRSFQLRLGLNTILQQYYPPQQWYTNFEPSYYALNGDVIGWNFKHHSYTVNRGRPVSLDGGIHPREFFKEVMHSCSWNNPREMDALDRDLFGYTMLSFIQSVLFCNSINLVFPGRADNYGHYFPRTTEELNKEFLTGKRLIALFNPNAIISSHWEVETKFV